MRTALQNLQSQLRKDIPMMDFHMHTSWTDGQSSVAEMHAEAVQKGLKFILFSEHARATSGDWFAKFAAEVRALPQEKCRAYVGVETKVTNLKGELDCTDEILNLCDVVMASVHRFPGEKGVVRGFGEVRAEEALPLELELARAILANPRVDILAHPFGMCLRRYQVDVPMARMQELIQKAAKTNVAFEINCHYHPNPLELLEACRAAGAPISLGSNAHELKSVGRIIRVLQGSESVV